MRKNLLCPGFRKTLSLVLAGCMLFVLCGCDMIYRLLQREGAEERDLIGEIVPFEPNARVAEVQKLLKIYGYKVGTVDGFLGVNTRNAVEAFQEDHGINPSRFIDLATWEKLHEFVDQGLIVDGELNVFSIQRVLIEAGLNPGPVDGKRGRRTEVAIRAFQKRNGLAPDGRVGIKTLEKLAEYLNEETRRPRHDP